MIDVEPAARVGGLPLSHPIAIGGLRVHVIEAGIQWFDGGAMFGVVPKTLWERCIPPDPRNRIPLALRCLLVESEAGLVVVETGIGNKESAKFREVNGVENAPVGDMGADRLQSAILQLGFDLAEVVAVINTHLHFDHAGGNTFTSPSGRLALSFPDADYFVQRGEWESAHAGNERTSASYLRPNFDPLQAAGRLRLLVGEAEVVPGISVIPTPGHTPFHQSVMITSQGESACFMGDVIPTMAHLPLPWIMAYDVEPLLTLETRKGLLRLASDGGWLLISAHDPLVPYGRVDFDGGHVELRPGL